MISNWSLRPNANLGFTALIVVFCASLVLNVILILKVKSPLQPTPSGVAVGSYARDIRLIEGSNIDLRGMPTILYITRPKCIWCARNHANVRALASHAASKYQFIGLSATVNGLRDDLLAFPLPFEVHALDMEHLPKGFNPTITPQMVLVRSDGIVEKVWVGALSGNAQAEVEAFFHTNLPGLPKNVNN